jgi:DNA repair exonuclease SbcCD ATPase subunit
LHIQFNTIRYKNILSVGNTFIEIPLDKHNTTLISGKNGAGKSLSIEAIVFALFGKPYRKINKPQLVNSINQKELIVELEFTISSDKFFIRRGLKPAIFEIWKNGELINKDAATRDYQAYLEQNIIKMSLKSFTQIVILGSATYVPFMDLPAGQRREIIEDLLDIQVFSIMNNLLKERVNENKTSITENNYQIDLVKTKLNSAKEHNAELERIKQTEVDKLRTKVSENINTIETNNSRKIEVLETQITELLETISDKQKQKKLQDQLKTLEYDLKANSQSFQKKPSFIPIMITARHANKALNTTLRIPSFPRIHQKTEELTEGLRQLDSKKAEVEERLDTISKVEDEINNLHSSANELRLANKMLMNQLKSIKTDLLNAEKEVEAIDQTKLHDLAKELSVFSLNRLDYITIEKPFL